MKSRVQVASSAKIQLQKPNKISLKLFIINVLTLYKY